MLKTIDTIAITIISLLLIFTWTYFIVDNIWWTIAISLVSYVLIWSIFKIVKMKKKDNYTPKKLANHFALMGQSYVAKLLMDNLDFSNKQFVDDKYIRVDDEIIYPMFKFGNINYENIASLYRLAKENDVKKIYLLSSGIEKNALVLAGGLDVSIEYVSEDVVFNYLKKKNSLPEIVESKEKPINKLGLKALLKGITSRANTKYYVLCGVLFAFISFISPNKIYYIVLSTIVFVLAILTFLPIFSNKSQLTNSQIKQSDFEKLLYDNTSERANENNLENGDEAQTNENEESSENEVKENNNEENKEKETKNTTETKNSRKNKPNKSNEKKETKN